MSNKDILLNIRKELEQSILDTRIAQLEATKQGNYQVAADFQQQIIGREFAIAVINEKLDRFEDEYR